MNVSASQLFTFMNLVHRSTKAKSAKGSNDGEYRAVFDNLISDLLTVLHWPEWPAASFTLNIATRFLVSAQVPYQEPT